MERGIKRMKKCIHCGKEIEDDDKFCPKCGFPQVEEKEKHNLSEISALVRKCPNCGADVKGRYCPECGYDLENITDKNNDSNNMRKLRDEKESKDTEMTNEQSSLKKRPNCGKEVEGQFCTYCGAKLTNNIFDSSTITGLNSKDYSNAKTKSTIAFIFGIIGTVFGFMGIIFAIIGIVLGIIGLVLSKSCKKDNYESGILTAGYILSIVAIILGAIMVVIILLTLHSLFAFSNEMLHYSL